MCVLGRLEGGLVKSSRLASRQLAQVRTCAGGFPSCDVSIGMACRQVCEAFSQSVIDMRECSTHCGWGHLWEGGPGCYRKTG